MTFLSPWMLLGLAAAAVPVVIHLVGRRRARRLPFAAVDFLLASRSRIARWMRVRQLLLLALRTLAVIALVLMMARPAWESETEVPLLVGQAQSVVLVVDDTLSMRRWVDGETIFARARQRAIELLALMGARAELAVLRVTAPEGPLATLTRDRRRIKAAIQEITPTYRHAEVSTALGQAARILKGATLRARHILLLSDMAAHGLPKRAIQFGDDIGLHPVDVAPRGPAENRAVVELRADSASVPGRRSMMIVARVCNFGAQSARTEVLLDIDGQHVARGSMEVAAGACNNKRFYHTFARSGGHEVMVSLPHDQLRADDRRYLLLDVQADIRVLLINGSPSPIRHRDELFYIEAALEAAKQAGQRIVSHALRVEDLRERDLSAFDVVALCNVSDLRGDQVKTLKAFVERGGGLLITVGDSVRADPFNAALAPLLPQQLRGPVRAAGGSDEAALRLGQLDVEHPIVAPIWRPDAGAGLRRAQFFRVYRLRPAVDRDRRVVMRYDDGSPALVEAMRGSGRVLLLTSTIDRDWNDLPIRPGFVPLIQQMVRYLAGAPVEQPRRDVLVGSVYSVGLPPKIDQIRLVAPNQVERTWSRRDLGGRDEVAVTVDDPGFYRLSAVIGGRSQPIARGSFVGNVDPVESQLNKGLLPARKGRSDGGSRALRQVELWHGLGAVLLVLLLLESLLTRRG